MEYQVGQAVIYKEKLWFVTHVCSSNGVDLKNMLGQYELTVDKKLRPATEAEILAEAQKHGWLKGKRRDWMINSPSYKLYIADIDGWEPQIKYAPLPNEWAIFGNECITAHRLITALNLAKQ